MKKIKINMYSIADSVPGQGVGSAYLDQLDLLKEDKSNKLEIMINSKEDADIHHFHSIDPKNYFRLIFSKKIKVVSAHFLTDTLEGALRIPKIFMNVFKWYLRSFYRKADYIVAVSPILVDGLVSYGINRDKIYVIPNYVSNSNFFPIEKYDEELIEKYHIDRNKKIVLGVGQIVYRKGIMDFVDIATKFPDVQFLWCGDFFFGSQSENYKELKSVCDNPPKNVKFLGKLSRRDMNQLYNLCDVFLNPSYKETFSMTVMEASKVYKPLLLRDLDVYKDIFFDKYLKCNNNEEFVYEISKLFNDSEYYGKAVQNSQYINNYYSKENVLSKWINFYQEIMKK